MEIGSGFPDGLLDTAFELGVPSDRGVRVWFRRPGELATTVRLETEGHPPVGATIPASAATDWTGAAELALAEPAPGQPFVVSIGTERRIGRFAPSPEAREGLAFGFGSCNRPFAPGPNGAIELLPSARIYLAMREELLANDAAFILLVGDQIYSDEIPSISVRDNLPGDDDRPPPLDLAVGAYRQVSRGYLGQRGFAALRAALPTVCAWDDHDIFNDWGSRRERTPFEKRLFEAASRAFWEYQCSRNPGATPDHAPPPYSCWFRYGTIGFLVLDIRGCRDYRAGTLLGAAQWEWGRSLLRGRETEAVETLFVVASVPIAHFSRWISVVFDHLPGGKGDNARDRWAARAFVDSRDALLDALFVWERERPQRQVALLSGDVHAASAFTIRPRGGPGVIQQFTSSALTTPASTSERWQNRIGTRLPNLFEPRFRFSRRFLITKNNYGLARLEPLPAGGHRIELEIRVWDTDRQRLITGGRVVTEPER